MSNNFGMITHRQGTNNFPVTDTKVKLTKFKIQADLLSSSTPKNNLTIHANIIQMSNF